ncbi:hypothetical protein DL766_003623 [Monosporascus sp. MC13-8B]|uniref:Uncharacterized protein n=1 Tax=Monosporascus cannonballus TaxID=155416 RepID=A0ABY0GVI2_9PEZI|nr:hypothetical protein DL762_009823 [Monosporascus cannonballus]RYP33191.1 hypothetical protein DL766_003623 [Monosporascus sp. MC13-8B]
MVTATRAGARVFDPLGFRHFGWVKLYAWRPDAEGAAAARARLLKADAEDEGWDWVSGAPPECINQRRVAHPGIFNRATAKHNIAAES